ncbi:unnamed protein product [Aspergillus oryzae]|nr:unnamed protein product [Aspergillus oryzae]
MPDRLNIFQLVDGFTAPTHQEHMADLASPVQEVDHGQVNCAEKDRDGSPLGSPEDTINIRLSLDLIPQVRRGSLSDDRIPICGARDFEGRSRCSTASYGGAVDVEILVQLLLNPPNQTAGVNQVLVAGATLSMELDIRAAVIQRASSLQAQQTLLGTKLSVVLVPAVFVRPGARLTG